MKDKDEKKKAIEVLESLHGELAGYALQAKMRHRRLEMALLVISAVTSGSLWALLVGVAETAMAWVGAILSTVVTLLTAYKKTLGPEEVYESAAELYRKTGELLADVRSSNDFDSAAFWHTYKFIQAEMIAIRWIKEGKEGDPPIPE